jgi:hypothetical protein
MPAKVLLQKASSQISAENFSASPQIFSLSTEQNN